jgi:hypothetical protein
LILYLPNCEFLLPELLLHTSIVFFFNVGSSSSTERRVTKVIKKKDLSKKLSKQIRYKLYITSSELEMILSSKLLSNHKNCMSHNFLNILSLEFHSFEIKKFLIIIQSVEILHYTSKYGVWIRNSPLIYLKVWICSHYSLNSKFSTYSSQSVDL